MRKEVVTVPNARPRAMNLPWATKCGDLVFTSGVGPRNPKTGEVTQGDIRVMGRQTMENLKMILESAGTSLDNVLKMSCYLREIKDIEAWNEVFVEYFGQNPPARITFQVPLVHFPIEIEAVACVPGGAR